MNILVIGSGGREHAIVHKFSTSEKCSKLWVSPGNPAMKDVAICVTLSGQKNVVQFCKKESIDLVFIGPEQPLSEGLVDVLQKNNINVIGPTQKAAQIESSKIFAKDLMKKYNIPTARYDSFSVYEEAEKYLRECSFPQVLKADGLAAGKGVVIAQTLEAALNEAKAMLEEGKFGDAGANLVIEEFMVGWEASIFAFCDGNSFVSTIFSQDHKAVYDGDKGPNTGGMGAYAPVDKASKYKTFVDENIIQPTLDAMKKEDAAYTGVLYVGLMITEDGPKVVEFNCRFGDPETEVILPLLKTDLVDVCDAILEQKASSLNLEWYAQYAVAVVGASAGYPGSYEKGKEIFFPNKLEENAMIYYAGVTSQNESLLTAGGRVLMATAKAENLKEAQIKAYDLIKKTNFDGMFYRKDIGAKGL